MLNRRLLMAQAGATPPGDWDIDWKYTDGPLENFGFTLQNNTSKIPEIRDDGLHIFGTGSISYMRYVPPVETCKKGVSEILVSFASMPTGNGLRYELANGTSGLQVFAYSDAIYYQRQGSHIKCADLANPKEFMTIRLEYTPGNNKVYLNGTLIHEDTIDSSLYVRGNFIMSQTWGTEIVIKEIRYKFIER